MSTKCGFWLTIFKNKKGVYKMKYINRHLINLDMDLFRIKMIGTQFENLKTEEEKKKYLIKNRDKTEQLLMRISQNLRDLK